MHETMTMICSGVSLGYASLYYARINHSFLQWVSRWTRHYSILWLPPQMCCPYNPLWSFESLPSSQTHYPKPSKSSSESRSQTTTLLILTLPATKSKKNPWNYHEWRGISPTSPFTLLQQVPLPLLTTSRGPRHRISGVFAWGHGVNGQQRFVTRPCINGSG